MKFFYQQLVCSFIILFTFLPCEAYASTFTWQLTYKFCVEFVGKDATNDFEDVGHSDSAREMMDKYYIGEVDVSTVPLKRIYVPPQQAHYNQDKTPEFIIKILQFVVPLLILGLAFVVRQYTKKED